MDKHLYLSLIPESLIASQLGPEAFGSYYAIGSHRRSRGQALFFEVEPGFQSDYFDWREMERRCVPHEDGQPKRSVYLGVYRVLEHVPLSAIKRFYLATVDGRVLGLDPGAYRAPAEDRYWLYQELCPITPRVVSRLSPPEFLREITDRSHAVSVDQMVFCDLALEGLAADPEAPHSEDMPYPSIDHLRDCLRELKEQPDKATKQVSRSMQSRLLFRTIENGFFVGRADEYLFFPMPSREELEDEHYVWWRSARNAFGE